MLRGILSLELSATCCGHLKILKMLYYFKTCCRTPIFEETLMILVSSIDLVLQYPIYISLRILLINVLPYLHRKHDKAMVFSDSIIYSHFQYTSVSVGRNDKNYFCLCRSRKLLSYRFDMYLMIMIYYSSICISRIPRKPTEWDSMTITVRYKAIIGSSLS